MTRHVLPPMPCVQGVGSTTFTPPPNTSLTVPEICDWHYKHSGAHPLYGYVDETANKVDTVSWHTAVQGIYSISHSVIVSVSALKTSETRPVIGLCSTSDSFTYLLTILGIMRAGYPVFLISPFASPAALTHLIATSGIPMILTNPDDLELHVKLLSAVAVLAIQIFRLSYPLSFPGTRFSRAKMCERTVRMYLDMTWNLPASSCTLQAECMVPQNGSHSALATLVRRARYLWRDHVYSISPHGRGRWNNVGPLSGIAPGLRISVSHYLHDLGVVRFDHRMSQTSIPPYSTKPGECVEGHHRYEGHICFHLTTVLYMFSPDPGKRKILAQLKGVVFSGGPVQKSVGDQLALEGANLLTFFGSSEGGLLNNVFTNDRGADWEFFCFYSLINPAFIPQENNDLFELVIKAGPFHKPTQTNIVCEDAAAFATKDLLLPHPQKPGFWKYVCRTDDQETLSMGMEICGSRLPADY